MAYSPPPGQQGYGPQQPYPPYQQPYPPYAPIRPRRRPMGWRSPRLSAASARSSSGSASFPRSSAVTSRAGRSGGPASRAAAWPSRVSSSATSAGPCSSCWSRCSSSSRTRSDRWFPPRPAHRSQPLPATEPTGRAARRRGATAAEAWLTRLRLGSRTTGRRDSLTRPISSLTGPIRPRPTNGMAITALVCGVASVRGRDHASSRRSSAAISRTADPPDRRGRAAAWPWPVSSSVTSAGPCLSGWSSRSPLIAQAGTAVRTRFPSPTPAARSSSRVRRAPAADLALSKAAGPVRPRGAHPGATCRRGPLLPRSPTIVGRRVVAISWPALAATATLGPRRTHWRACAAAPVTPALLGEFACLVAGR